MTTFHQKVTAATVQTALKKFRVECPTTALLMDTFIFRNPHGFNLTPTQLGETLFADAETADAQQQAAINFFGQIGRWFAVELDVTAEVANHRGNTNGSLPESSLAVFTWDTTEDRGEAASEVVFCLRPEYVLAFAKLQAATA